MKKIKKEWKLIKKNKIFNKSAAQLTPYLIFSLKKTNNTEKNRTREVNK